MRCKSRREHYDGCDSIEVDILGAMNAGIDQVFVNHLGIEPSVKPTYVVSSIKRIGKDFLNQ